MKTTLKPQVDRVTLYADAKCGEKVGTVDLPIYEDKPKVIVFRDTIYIKRDSYYSRDYLAVESLHVATETEFTPGAEETPATPIDCEAMARAADTSDGGVECITDSPSNLLPTTAECVL